MLESVVWNFENLFVALSQITNKILKLSDQYKLQVPNYIFQLLHSNIDEKIESSLLTNKQIHSHNTRTNNQMSILSKNRSETNHCILHNGMITWNSLPDIFPFVPFVTKLWYLLVSHCGTFWQNIMVPFGTALWYILVPHYGTFGYYIMVPFGTTLWYQWVLHYDTSWYHQ